jgi:hypothetical protein
VLIAKGLREFGALFFWQLIPLTAFFVETCRVDPISTQGFVTVIATVLVTPFELASILTVVFLITLAAVIALD